MQLRKIALVAIVVLVGLVSANGYVHAQTNSTAGTSQPPSLSNQQSEVIIIATIVGSFSAPILQWATSNVDKTSAQITKFSWSQYAIAIIVVLPTSFGLIVTELQTVTFTGTNVQAYAIVFLMAFIQGMGLNSLKKSVAQAISNKAVQAQKA